MQVVADKVTFLGTGKREESDGRSAPTGQTRGNSQETQFADDVPF
jgi:hypothetical protein